MVWWETITENMELIAWTLTLITVWCGLRIYSVSTFGVCRCKKRLEGKTVLVTGCASGIGKATAFELARRGARVIMADINSEAANSVREQIVDQTDNPNVVVKVVDLSLLQSVRQFAEDIKSSESRLDLLIHNAGILKSPNPATEEGLNTVLATNVFGPFLLTHLLMDLLMRSGNSRILVAGSTSYRVASVDLDNPNPLAQPSLWERSTFKLYTTSKLAVTLLTKELARRLTSSGVTVNCAHPGVVNTPIAGFPLPKCAANCIPFVKTPEQGAQTLIHLSVSEEVEGVSGKYFADCKEEPTTKLCEDEVLAKQYWEICERIVHLTAAEEIVKEP